MSSQFFLGVWVQLLLNITIGKLDTQCVFLFVYFLTPLRSVHKLAFAVYL